MQSVTIKWKKCNLFLQDNEMMLRSVIHTFVEYRRFRLFCLVLEKKYYLSRGTIKKECRDYILTNEPMEIGNVYKCPGFVISPYHASCWYHWTYIWFNHRLKFLDVIFLCFLIIVEALTFKISSEVTKKLHHIKLLFFRLWQQKAIS